MPEKGVSIAQEAATRGADIVAGIAQEWLADQSHNTCDEYAVRCWLSSYLEEASPSSDRTSDLKDALERAVSNMESAEGDLRSATWYAKEVLDMTGKDKL